MMGTSIRRLPLRTVRIRLSKRDSNRGVKNIL